MKKYIMSLILIFIPIYGMTIAPRIITMLYGYELTRTDMVLEFLIQSASILFCIAGLLTVLLLMRKECRWFHGLSIVFGLIYCVIAIRVEAIYSGTYAMSFQGLISIYLVLLCVWIYHFKSIFSSRK